MVITLLTDFGLHDTYGGVMKGAIATLAPAIPVVDLTHQIPPQDVAAGRFALMVAYPYFPQGTVHVGVVDPGVGTERRGVAIATPQGYLVGPDNGLLTGVLERYGAIAAVTLDNPHYWRTPIPSATFHGRDIFAPVAAHLALGVPLSALGTDLSLEALVRLPIPHPQCEGEDLIGHIQSIDHFGNLITTLPAPGADYQGMAWVQGQSVPWGRTYGTVPLGSAVALGGSHGYGEIAIHGGSAQEFFQAQLGDAVRLSPNPHLFPSLSIPTPD